MLSASLLDPADLFEIERQPSQLLLMGVAADPEMGEAEALADNPAAWTLRGHDGRIVACLGIHEAFPGSHGVAWALLAPGIGAAHHALTRFARQVVDHAAARLARIEAIVDPGAPERWARLIGLPPVHLMRNMGAASEPKWLCERIRADG